MASISEKHSLYRSFGLLSIVLGLAITQVFLRLHRLRKSLHFLLLDSKELKTANDSARSLDNSLLFGIKENAA
jgi:hypothetical protein